MLPPLTADSLSAQATRRSEGCSPEALSERAQVVWRLVREAGSRSYILQKGVQTESRDRCRGRQDLPHFVRLKRTATDRRPGPTSRHPESLSSHSVIKPGAPSGVLDPIRAVGAISSER